MPICVDSACSGMECGYCDDQWLWGCTVDPAAESGCQEAKDFWCQAGSCVTGTHYDYVDSVCVPYWEGSTGDGYFSCGSLCSASHGICGYYSPTQEEYDALGELKYYETKEDGPYAGRNGISPLTTADTCACGNHGGVCESGKDCLPDPVDGVYWCQTP